MSMSSMPRTSGVSTAALQQQQPAQNFKPKSEWKHQDDARSLFVYLPGFARGQLTVTRDHSNRTVRIEGKRRLPNNRLLPVDETYSIPEDCELSKMDERFEQGTLILKMPRNIVVTQVVAQQQSGNEKPGRQESLVQNDGVKEEGSKAESKEVKESAMTSAMSVAKVDEKENEKKQKNPKPSDAGRKEAKKEKVNASANKGLVKEMNEDRKLLVNMGAAVLIIVVLGVSLFYTISHKLVD